MLQEDKILLEKVKNSDKVAFKKLFFNYHDTLSRFVLYKVQDKDIAEDITQETFLRVWKTRLKLRPNKSFFSLIARISTNLCYDHFRHTEVRQRHETLIPINHDKRLNQPEENVLGEALENEIQKITDSKINRIDEIINGYKFNPSTKRKELVKAPKFELLASHDLRRSFATYHYDNGKYRLSIKL